MGGARTPFGSMPAANAPSGCPIAAGTASPRAELRVLIHLLGDGRQGCVSVGGWRQQNAARTRTRAPMEGTTAKRTGFSPRPWFRSRPTRGIIKPPPRTPERTNFPIANPRRHRHAAPYAALEARQPIAVARAMAFIGPQLPPGHASSSGASERQQEPAVAEPSGSGQAAAAPPAEVRHHRLPRGRSCCFACSRATPGSLGLRARVAVHRPRRWSADAPPCVRQDPARCGRGGRMGVAQRQARLGRGMALSELGHGCHCARDDHR